MKYTQLKSKTQKGFTLVELSMVLVVIGLLMGVGVGMMGMLIKRTKYAETKETVNAAIESIISFGAANNRLPCAINDNNGICGSKGDEFTPAVRNPTDTWSKPLYYIYDNKLTDPSIGGICGRKTTDLTIRKCPNAACTSPTTISNVAFVILSGGENYNNQTSGTRGVTAATNINLYDIDVGNIDNYAGDMNRPESYDDIVKWITLDELRIKAGCVGPQLKILNNELPSGKVLSSYAATIYADGGVPYATGGKYRWCRQGSSSTGLTFSPGTLNTDCMNLAEGSWGRSDNLTISGTPSGAGSFNFTFFVRDNNARRGTNDNIAQKTFVITINP